jgi:hypothetical protein
MAYAENTEVAVEKSVGEIVGLIKKAGADRVAQAEEPGRIIIQFFLQDRLLRFAVNLPAIDTIPKMSGNYQSYTDAQRQKKLEQRHKQRARALLLVIKAKLESVESGVETFEEAFLANVVMPDGKTIGDLARPQIESAYSGGPPQPLMLTGGS